mgnify:CR=1 FL=1
MVHYLVGAYIDPGMYFDFALNYCLDIELNCSVDFVLRDPSHSSGAFLTEIFVILQDGKRDSIASVLTSSSFSTCLLPQAYRRSQ